jgi:hypothetical protein
MDTLKLALHRLKVAIYIKGITQMQMAGNEYKSI